jgi:hypothetical protein
MPYIEAQPRSLHMIETIGLREINFVADKPAQFVSGYVCPGCKFESQGLPLKAFGESRAGWAYRIADGPDLRIQCSMCNAEVPRELWRFNPLEN